MASRGSGGETGRQGPEDAGEGATPFPAHPIDQLIWDVFQTGRTPDDAEWARVRRHIARVGFDPRPIARVGGRIAGVPWQGTILSSRDRLTSAEVHYLRHVVVRLAWPAGTTLQDYLESIRSTVLDETAGILLSLYQGELQVGIVGRSGAWQGPNGRSRIHVEYRVGLGHWVTALQIEIQDLASPRRSDVRWLVQPR